MADAFTQALLGSPWYVQLVWIGILASILIWMATPLLWTWLAFRFFRDVHTISESLHWIAHCTKSDRQIEPVRAHPVTAPPGGITTSAFGR